MSIQFFQIDSFATDAFSGNPAAVCLMETEADDTWLQRVAAEMNLSETAFVWRQDHRFHLRWFTPVTEVDLCGHATLAAAQALWTSGWLGSDSDAVFTGRSGELRARHSGGKIWLDFPAAPPESVATDDGILKAGILKALGLENAVWFGKNKFDYFIQLADEEAVRNCRPDFVSLKAVTERGAIVTAEAQSEGVDFVSRFFGPACGIDEDPVTGSAHVGLAPFWAERLGRNQLTGFQASERGGFVETIWEGERVQLGGTAMTVVQGELLVAPD